MTYNKTIPTNYRGRSFLLSSRDKKGLLIRKSNRYEIHFNKDCAISVNTISELGEREQTDEFTSLRKIGIILLRMTDPTVRQVLGYLVLPEVEVERIFNSLRFKYLSVLLKTDSRYKPYEYITSDCNDFFKALIGRVPRGTAKRSKSGKIASILSDNCVPKGTHIRYDKEYTDLAFILKYLLNCSPRKKSAVYRELISIKPGFHEVFMDKVHQFEHRVDLQDSKKKDRRSSVLRMIHRLPDKQKENWPDIAHEINARTYITYATCNITEGPFIYRRFLDQSYFTALHRMPKGATVSNFNRDFAFLDYKRCIPSKVALTNLLCTASTFLVYPNLARRPKR